MKKLLAMALTVAMLLTCLVALPVSADNLPTAVYLDIVNASFEEDEVGATDITGWTKNYAKPDIPWKIEQEATHGAKCIAVGGGTAVSNWLTQTISIPESVTANMSDYTWYFKALNTYCTYVKIKVYNAAGTTVEELFTDFGLQSAAWHDSILNVTSVMTAVENPTKIDLSFAAHNNWGKYDEMRLFGILNDTTGNLISNSDFSAVSAQGRVDSWSIGKTGTSANVLSEHVNDGAGNYYVTVRPNKDDSGNNTGAAGAVSQDIKLKDHSPYLFTVKYRAVGNRDAYVKIVLSGQTTPDGTKYGEQTVFEKELPATDTTAATVDAAQWGTYRTVLYLPDRNDTDTVPMNIALRAHPWGANLGAHYDDVSIIALALEEGNYIVNGDFEMEESGATDITGWVQLSSTELTKIISGTVSSGTKAISSGRGVQTYVPANTAMLSRRIMLSFNAAYDGGGAMPNVGVTVHATSGNKSISYPGYIKWDSETGYRGDPTNPYAWEYGTLREFKNEDIVIDLKDVINMVPNRMDITGFTINLNMSNSNAGMFDNIKLYNEGGVIVGNNVDLVTNGNFLDGLNGWTQKSTTALMTFHAGNVRAVSPEGVTGAGLKQVIDINTEAEWYKNYNDYKYTFSYASGSNSRWNRIDAFVTAVGANGATATSKIATTIAPDNKFNQMNAIGADLTTLLAKIGDQPVKQFIVSLEDNDAKEGNVDDVKLIVSKKEGAAVIPAEYVYTNSLEADDTGYTFIQTTAEASLKTDGKGTDGSNYAFLPASGMPRVDFSIPGASVEPNATYLLQIDYKSASDTGFYKIENGANAGHEIMLTGDTLTPTGTDMETALWRTASMVFSTDATVTKGINLLMRSWGRAEICYDNLRITKLATSADNLLFNGDFEYSALAGSDKIHGWINNGGIVTVTGTEGHDVKLTGTSVKQIVPINLYNSKNGANHAYKLEWDVSLSDGHHNIVVTANFADGTSATGTIALNRAAAAGDLAPTPGPSNKIENLVWNKGLSCNLASITQASTSPLVTLTIQLESVSGASSFDNLKLTALDGGIDITDAEGNVLNDVVTNEAATYVAKVLYNGTDAGATAYLGVYTLGEDGVLRLTKVTNGVIAAGAEDTSVKLDGVSAIAGSTVVKAFLWGTELNPLGSITID